jgi:hypothetical protein
VAGNKKQVGFEKNAKKMRMRACAEKGLESATEYGTVHAGLRRGSWDLCVVACPFCILGCLMLSGILAEAEHRALVSVSLARL